MKNFKFPPILGEDSVQKDAFAQIKHVVEGAAFKGRNGSVFAYGQTGSGKTYTVSGGERKANGIVQQAIQHVWPELRKIQAKVVFEMV